MGLKLFSDDKNCNCSNKDLNIFIPNPNPANYKVLRYEEVTFNNISILVIELKYSDCTNYKGRKILLYKNCCINDLLSQKEIDPHFIENNDNLYPFARFEPTNKGWDNAIRLASIMTCY